MRSALQALTKFKRLTESHQVDEVVAAATSAVREAENGREFLASIRQRTGIEVRVISGTEEARLIHRAAVYGVDGLERRGAGHRHRRRQRRAVARAFEPGADRSQASSSASSV